MPAASTVLGFLHTYIQSQQSLKVDITDIFTSEEMWFRSYPTSHSWLSSEVGSRAGALPAPPVASP